MSAIRVFFSLVVLMSLWGCSTKSDTYPALKLERKIGVILPMSSSRVATDVVDGMKLAQKLHNASVSPSDKMKLVFEDVSDSSKNPPLKALERLTADGIRVFCVGFDKDILLVHKLFSAMDGAFFNFMITYPPATLLGKNSTRIFFNSAQEGDMMASFEKTSPIHSSKYAIVSEDSPIGKSTGDFLNFSISTPTRKVFREYFTTGETNFDVFAKHIVYQNPRAIFYIGSGHEFNALESSLQSCGYKGLLLKNRGFRLFDSYATSSRAVVAKFELLSENKFKELFRREYGREPSVFAAWGFDGANLLFRAMKASGYELSGIRKSFLESKYEGAMGILMFDSSADCTAELLIK